jgi:hypothetical protein
MREILNEGQMLGFTLAELRRAIAHYDLPITDGSTHARKD